MKQLLIILILLTYPAISLAQTAKLLPQVVKEGSTAKLVVSFYDENDIATTTKTVAFFANDYPSDVSLQPLKTCVAGTCSSDYFEPATPSSVMKLRLIPCTNRILNEGGTRGERTQVSVVYSYPASCDLTVAGSCTWATGQAIFERHNNSNIVTCKGVVGTVLPDTDCSFGCPIKGTTCGVNLCP